MLTNQKYLFKCDRWLSDDEDDRKIEIELALDYCSDDDIKKKKNNQDSSSSWNSSEDEDSISFSGAKVKLSLVKPPNPNLNQIDELNETNASKVTNNFQTNEVWFLKNIYMIKYGDIFLNCLKTHALNMQDVL